MMGCIVFVFVNGYVPEFIGNTFFRNQFFLPTAPAEGLYLKGMDFKGYNNRQEIPEKLQFEEQHIKETTDKLQKEIQQFIAQSSPDIWDDWYQQVK